METIEFKQNERLELDFSDKFYDAFWTVANPDLGVVPVAMLRYGTPHNPRVNLLFGAFKTGRGTLRLEAFRPGKVRPSESRVYKVKVTL